MTATLGPVSRARATALFDKMRGLPVAIVGDLMLDRYLAGDVERISPEAPVPVVSVDEDRVVPGGAANVAANVAALGATPILIGVVGDDDAARSLVAALDALGIATNGIVVVPGRPTTTKTRIVARGQQVVRIDREVTNALPDWGCGAVRLGAMSAIAAGAALLLEDYDKGTIDATLAGELVTAGRTAQIPVVVDPKLRNFFAYSGATLFKPNLRELEAAFSTRFTEEDGDLEGARQRVGAEHLLVTLGADGMVLSSTGVAEVRRAPGLVRDVFDVAGAGDTVAAWVATSLAAGASVAEATWLANAAAGLEVGKRGTATVAPSEVLEVIDREQ